MTNGSGWIAGRSVRIGGILGGITGRWFGFVG
jgi:hypothetical protein